MFRTKVKYHRSQTALFISLILKKVKQLVRCFTFSINKIVDSLHAKGTQIN